jgi:pimeloyl-ACP methyl ester carboxylesterase
LSPRRYNEDSLVQEVTAEYLHRQLGWKSVYEETGHCPNWEQPERVATDIASLVLRR